MRDFNVGYGERWSDLAERGLVRWHAEPEIDSYDDIYGKDDDEETKLEIHNRIETEGFWIYMGQYRLGDTDPWESDDNIGGFIGLDFFGSGYDKDLASNTIAAYDRAVQSEADELESRATYAAGG